MSARVDGTRAPQSSRKFARFFARSYDRWVKNPDRVCEVCRAQVTELRRGRCWGCYDRWVEQRPVGLGARCTTCPEKRRRFLKTVELFGAWKPMCFNCAGVLLVLQPMPTTISALRLAVSR